MMIVTNPRLKEPLFVAAVMYSVADAVKNTCLVSVLQSSLV